MPKDPMVSVITPCFNGEKHLPRFLDSILAQTYNKIEFIFVNDGSKDNTENIFLSYKDRLENKGIRVLYIFQENKGLGGAINTGLKLVSGNYLCWPDADDYLEPESVEMRLQILEKYPEYAVVTSDAYIRSIDNLESPIGLVSFSFETNYDPFQFIHLLKGRSIFCSGSHMIRTDVFFQTHSSGEIYPSRYGQNYQMLLPIYYQHKRFFLPQPLYNYIRHGSGMSVNEDKGFKERVLTYNNQRNIILETLNSMDLSQEEKSTYSNMTHKRFSSLICKFSYDSNDYILFRQEFILLKKLKQISFKLRVLAVFFKIRQYIYRDW